MRPESSGNPLSASVHLHSAASGDAEGLRAELDALKTENARLAEAVAARDNFLAFAAHELMNGVSPIVGRVDVLRLKLDVMTSERIAQELDRIAGLTAMFARRATTLLDISRLTSGGLRVDQVEVDGNKVAADVVNSYGVVAELTGASLHLSVEGDNRLIGDAMSLGQVLDNLISNAIKYGGGKPVYIKVWSDDGRVHFEVRDDGQGISVENQARIFDRFERAVKPGSRTGGFGVGLWVVKQLTEAMNGQVEVASVPNQGTTFRVSLPSYPGGRG